MLEAAEKAIRFSEGRSRADLDVDELLALALVRLLEIVGEAATRVAETEREQHGTIPWAQIIGMRNRLIHGYDVVDLDVLWETVRKDLPQLIAGLRSIIPPS
jgi:uncharacterized protein with HEPN domain